MTYEEKTYQLLALENDDRKFEVEANRFEENLWDYRENKSTPFITSSSTTEAFLPLALKARRKTRRSLKGYETGLGRHMMRESGMNQAQ